MREGTAKLLTRFHPASGRVRVKGVRSAANAVVHPWLREELARVLATLPEVTIPEAERPLLARWETWLGHPPRSTLPPLRLILVWDHLAGHRSVAIVFWLFQRGVLPLDTPLSGSWLNLAMAWQRILVRRALAGTHPQSAEEIIRWIEETAAAWNEASTPFTWGGQRQERRQRARRRRLGGAAALVDYPSFVP
jgi:hypothetical protein